ncbi:hypothetical protein ABFG95_04000 [Achromobacter sp. HNDS-1]|jgi:hypothetical protein|uniref:Uncharacterized protein n=2 Tax=Achromobacter TaxID=222 RepID=A0A6S7EGL7_9BURK|nr:hypothetical protein [Achromobacter ruhlandii]MCI1835178.1 hypothetical protein [Achromobacter ruhlandii]CAB3727016.1 hypothetical protein LMG1866_04307 [Achromobacter ruhlandii]CAB3911807.1 hypothetical protein LMG3328_04839 [Achromobacter ruhlandii]
MTITPAMNLVKDVASTTVGTAKTASAPEGSLQKYSGAISTLLAGVGSLLNGLEVHQQKVGPFKPVIRDSLAGVSSLKNTLGAFPAIATIFIGAKKDDKPMVTLGALNLICASGFYNVAANFATDYSKGMLNKNMAHMVKNLPPVMKFGVGLVSLAYSTYAMIPNMQPLTAKATDKSSNHV